MFSVVRRHDDSRRAGACDGIVETRSGSRKSCPGCGGIRDFSLSRYLRIGREQDNRARARGERVVGSCIFPNARVTWFRTPIASKWRTDDQRGGGLLYGKSKQTAQLER